MVRIGGGVAALLRRPLLTAGALGESGEGDLLVVARCLHRECQCRVFAVADVVVAAVGGNDELGGGCFRRAAACRIVNGASAASYETKFGIGGITAVTALLRTNRDAAQREQTAEGAGRNLCFAVYRKAIGREFQFERRACKRNGCLILRTSLREVVHCKQVAGLGVVDVQIVISRVPVGNIVAKGNDVLQTVSCAATAEVDLGINRLVVPVHIAH